MRSVMIARVAVCATLLVMLPCLSAAQDVAPELLRIGPTINADNINSFYELDDPYLDFVRSIDQDGAGFMWFGGDGRLVRFDGREIEDVTTGIGQPGAYRVKRLDDRMFVGTNRGFVLIDWRTLEVTARVEPPSSSIAWWQNRQGMDYGELFISDATRVAETTARNEFLNYWFYDAIVDSDGNYWFATDGGVTKTTPDLEITIQISTGGAYPTASQLPGVHALSLFEAAPGEIWVGMYPVDDEEGVYQGGIVVIRDDEIVERIPLTEFDEERAIGRELPQRLYGGWSRIFSIVRGEDDAIYVTGGNLARFSDKDAIPTVYPEIGSSGRLRVSFGVHPELDRTVVATGAGAHYWHHGREEWISHPVAPNETNFTEYPWELSGGVFKDAQGNYWFGGNSGVHVWREPSDKFFHVPSDDFGAAFEIERVDARDRIWWRDRVFEIRQNDLVELESPIPTDGGLLGFVRTNDRSTDREIAVVEVEDSKGALLFDFYDLDGALLRSIDVETGIDEEGNDRRVEWVSEIARTPDGTLWFLTRQVENYFLWRYDEDASRFVRVLGDLGWATNLVVNDAGNIVLAHSKRSSDASDRWADVGWFELDPVTEEVIPYPVDLAGREGLPTNAIDSFGIGAENRLWFSYLETENPSVPKFGFASYRDDEGYRFYENFYAFQSVHAGSDGYVWALGHNAMTRFDPETGAVYELTQRDGIVGGSLMSIGSLTSTNVPLMPTAYGLDVLKPSATFEPLNPPIVIKNARIDDETVELAVDEFPESIVLAHTADLLELDLRVLDYSNPENTTIEYRINDEEWIEAIDDELIALRRPARGDYTLQIRWADGHRQFVPEGMWLSVPLRSLPHPLASRGAVAAYSVLGAVLIALAFYLLDRQRRTKIASQQLELNREHAARERLERLDHLKDAFLANTSHELRTPLHGMVGLAEGLLSGAAGEPSDQMRENLSMIVSSGRRLSTLVNDILDFSKIQEGDLELQTKTVDVFVAADISLSLIRPIAERKGISLDNSIDRNLPLVDADPNRLQQILINILGNAVKFTSDGSVTISAHVENGRVQVSVVDTGIGIPEDKIDGIFRSFEQVDTAVEREYGGTGLGLTVTKQLVKLHGGDVTVESAPGKGSTFTFDLAVSGNQDAAFVDSDLARLAPESYRESGPTDADARDDLTRKRVELASTGAPDALAKLKILIVDDEPVNLQILANHLSVERYQVLQAINGDEALELARKEKPDLVLLDVMMPRMNGYEVCEAIRSDYPAAETPVIMLTARNQVSDLVQGLDAGANDYIAKPFNKDELLARIRTHLELAKINVAYGNFVPREFLEQLEKQSILDVRLGDQVSRTMSILFSDIRGFTTISEGLTPEQTFELINGYLSEVVPPIRAHDGFVDKFIGDGIMALFPNEPDTAISAALDMQRALRRFNQSRIDAGAEEIRTGIGIHTGDLILGTIGEARRMEETVVSDAVNVASRIEGLTKIFGNTVLISEATRKALEAANEFETRLLGKVAVKGRAGSTTVHEVLGDDSVIKGETRAAFEAALQSYFNREFDVSVGQFGAVLRQNPNDAAAAFYRRQSATYINSPPAADWDGTEVIEQK